MDEGAKVVASDINAEGLEKAFPSSSTYATNVATVSANVTVAADWDKLVETATSKFGGVDILVNNAGTSYKNKPTLEVTEAEFDRVFAVNVKSIYLSVAAVVPALQKRGGGSIINIASIGAMRPRPGLVWYNASKGAVANVSRKSLTPQQSSLKAQSRVSLLATPRKSSLRKQHSADTPFFFSFYRQPKGSPQNSAKTRSASTRCVRYSPARACSKCSSACRTPRRI